MAEKVDELIGDNDSEIDAYDLVYKTPNGTVVVNNDEMNYQSGTASVGIYQGDAWTTMGEATEVREFTDLDEAADFAANAIKNLAGIEQGTITLRPDAVRRAERDGNGGVVYWLLNGEQRTAGKAVSATFLPLDYSETGTVIFARTTAVAPGNKS